MKRTHPTAEAARTELAAHGYSPAHQRPSERGTRWSKPKGKRRKVDESEDLVIAEVRRPRSSIWQIMPAAAMRAGA